MKSHEKELFVREFTHFLAGEPAAVPPELSHRVEERVESVLHPSPWQVLTKFAGIVFSVGVLTLTLCPQFGVGFARESGLFEYFMTFGQYGCRFFCGAFFFGSGLLLSALVMREEDIKIIRRRRVLKIAGLASVALAGFVAAGGAVFSGAALFWLLGAVVGGIASFETGYFLKRGLA